MRKAQSILEYTILMIVIITAFMSVQVYMKRGFQGRWKQATDDLGEQYDVAAFDSTVRYTLNTTTFSNATAVNGLSTSGEKGMITYRQDSAVTVETKEGQSHIEPAGL